MKLILIGGEDSYHAEEKLQSLKANYQGKYPGIQISSFYGDELESLNQIHALVGEVGFFSQTNLVVLRQVISDARVDIRERLAEMLTNLVKQKNETLHIILFERGKIDKRSKLYKLCKDKGEVFEFGQIDEMKTEGFIKEYLWQAGLELNVEVRRILVGLLAGQSLYVIKSELDKLAVLAAAEGRSIQLEDLSVVNRERAQDVWELFYLAGSDKAKAYELLDNLLAQQVHYLQITGFLALELRKLLQYYYFPADLKPFIRNRVRPLASRHSPRKLKIMIDKLLNLDVLMKTTNFDPRLGLTLYLSIL